MVELMQIPSSLGGFSCLHRFRIGIKESVLYTCEFPRKGSEIKDIEPLSRRRVISIESFWERYSIRKKSEELMILVLEKVGITFFSEVGERKVKKTFH